MAKKSKHSSKNSKKFGRVQRANARKAEWDQLSPEEKKKKMAERKALYDFYREPYPAMYLKTPQE